jgi:Fe-Mn family superoxide dismutase
MKKIESRKFNIPKLKGISEKNIEEHLKLYEGYVKHFNLIHEIVEDQNQQEFVRREVYRRQAFEYDGIRNHEMYFGSLEGGAKPLAESSELNKKIVSEGSTLESRIEIFKNLATTRGIGWAILGYDKHNNTLIQYWVDEQHLGHLTGVVPILALDMWEHSYVADYQPSGKKQYIEDFFANLNWQVIEKNFSEATK